MSSPRYSGNSSQAVDKCQQDGDEVAEYTNNIERGILTGVGSWFFRYAGM